MKILSWFALCAFFPISLFSAELPKFSYSSKPTVLKSDVIPKEITNFTLPKQFKLIKVSFDKLKPKFLEQKKLFVGRSVTDAQEASSIKGIAPKCLYRNSRFLTSRVEGKIYTSENYFYYIGGAKPLWWRADPRDVAIFAGSGLDF